MVDKNFTKETRWLLEEKYNGNETQDFFKDLDRLKAGEPIDYLIGSLAFLGCRIDLSSHPLIPRTETEWWVEKAIHEISTAKKELRILDIFSGSGCIGVALLQHLPKARVDFGEKEPRFVEQIRKNISLNHIDPKRTQVYESDAFAHIPEKKYDYIFANPPYISRRKIDNVQSSVLKHEPEGALFAEEDGLFYIKKLIAEAPRFLAAGGKLFVEFDSWQKEEIEHIANDSPFQIEFRKDQFDKWRTSTASL